MRYLLDTHAILWMRANDPHFSRKKWEPILMEGGHDIFFSTVSLWEMSIKRSIGKLNFKGTLLEFNRSLTEHYGFQHLMIEPTHLHKLESLPFHHQDPFDRLMIAQALDINATCITCDRIWSSYSVSVEW